MRLLTAALSALILLPSLGCREAAPPESEPATQQDPGPGPGPGRGGGPLENLAPGTFQTMQMQGHPTVYEAVETTFSRLDSELGQRIQSMYQRMEGRGWEKTGPALVAIRGDRGGEQVQAEVTFGLVKEAPDAAEVELQQGELPGGKMAVVVHLGPRSNLAATDTALDGWISSQGLQARGDLRWYVFLNRPDEVTEAELLTAVVQPVQ